MIIATLLYLPIPNTEPVNGSLSLLKERAMSVSGEAAVSSRWNLLPELLEEIKKAPVLGQGLGAVVTYQSSDPRILESTAGQSGTYTTFAFEWGYLDMVLKFGTLGILFYLFYLGLLIKNGFIFSRDALLLWSKGQKITLETTLGVGLFFGYLMLLMTNGFSPYLNHPLGVGYLLLFTVFLLKFQYKFK